MRGLAIKFREDILTLRWLSNSDIPFPDDSEIAGGSPLVYTALEISKRTIISSGKARQSLLWAVHPQHYHLCLFRLISHL
jgi:hypothetical protein